MDNSLWRCFSSAGTEHYVRANEKKGRYALLCVGPSHEKKTNGEWTELF